MKGVNMFRRLFLAVFCLLIVTSHSHGAIALDQHASTDNNVSTLSTIVVVLTGTAPNSHIVCNWTISGTSGIAYTSITDNVNAGSYSIAIASHTVTSVGQIEGQSYKENNAGGTVTITAQFTHSNAFGAMGCQSRTGVALTGSLDVAATVKDSTGTNPTANSMTTTANGDVIVSAALMSANTPTAGAGFTLRDSMTDTLLFVEDTIQTTAGAIAASWTAASDSYSVMQASYKAAAGGGPIPVMRHRESYY
jgi:hypothetical protein